MPGKCVKYKNNGFLFKHLKSNQKQPDYKGFIYDCRGVKYTLCGWITKKPKLSYVYLMLHKEREPRKLKLKEESPPCQPQSN